MLFLDGPRVNAALIGGEVMGEALCTALGDVEALSGDRVHVDDGVQWGRVVRARTVDEPAAKVWFCPPRPLTPAHWDGLTRSIAGSSRAA